MPQNPITRRDFVKATGAAAAALAMPALAEQDEKPIRVALIGCGGRGTGAAHDCMRSAPGVHLVAMGDVFEDRLKSSRGWLAKNKHAGFRVTDEMCFTGFDAYKRILDLDVDLVLLTTPPGFRPGHFEAAVDAGKHAFLEKPVAVDPAGVRRVRAAGKKAAEKGLAVVAGTQYRHQAKFKLTIDEIHKGRIGPVVSGRAYYNAGTLWHRGQKKEWSDVEYQVRNWLYFDWLSGDHIVEQHIHTIDVTNWVMQGPPVRAVAMGGRQVRSQQKYGNIYDHFAVDYEYPSGAHVISMCRQMRGTSNHVGAYFEGTKGRAAPYQGKIHTDPEWTSPDLRGIGTAYVQEHTDLIESVRAGKPLNETEQVCDSTLTAIMGREAAYTGQMLTWKQMLTSELDYGVHEEFKPLAVRPVPMPGPQQ